MNSPNDHKVVFPFMPELFTYLHSAMKLEVQENIKNTKYLLTIEFVLKYRTRGKENRTENIW